MAKSKNPHVSTATKAFANWTQAKHHAEQLLDSGEISKGEYNQIKYETGGGSAATERTTDK